MPRKTNKMKWSKLDLNKLDTVKAEADCGEKEAFQLLKDESTTPKETPPVKSQAPSESKMTYASVATKNLPVSKPASGKVALANTHLEHLSDDILMPIFETVLTHHTPLPVTMTFEAAVSTHPEAYLDKKRHSLPPLNYSILHTSRRFYSLGLRVYYESNTFVLDIAEFQNRKSRDGLQNWPNIGTPNAFGYIKSLVLTMKTAWLNWDDVARVLRPFTALEAVLIDHRATGQTSYFDWTKICYETEQEVTTHYPALLNPLWHAEYVRGPDFKSETQVAEGGKPITHAKGTKKIVWNHSDEDFIVENAPARIKQALFTAGVRVQDRNIMIATLKEPFSEKEFKGCLIRKIWQGCQRLMGLSVEPVPEWANE